ncbi:MAG: hypothetical protein JKY67_12480 [Pseudomonadales bacterium]|nr:hypothetical protein [Pseudomonadales bacterium]
MNKIERMMIWLGHLGMLTAAGTLFYQDEIGNPYVGALVFFAATCSYTLGLAISLYLDSSDQNRKANNPDEQSIGSVLKPALLACLCVVIAISIVVVVISEYAKTIGVL